VNKRLGASNSQSSLALIAGVVSGVAVVGGLYWAQSILVPVALAILLAFLLSPAVKALQRWHLDRRLAVVVVVLSATTAIVAAGWLVKIELTNLAAGLPIYTENIQAKIQQLKGMGQRAGSGHLAGILENLTGARDQSPAQVDTANTSAASTEADPKALVGDGNWQARLLGLLGMVMSSAASMAFALVLVIFMLLEREPLRNRLICLMGQGRMTVTTKALDDTGARISRYLHMQFALNSSYGVVWGGALYMIGVDYALLWGFLAGVMRYIPYLGAWLGALFPIALSLAQFPGWWPTLIVIGVVLVLELIWNNALEPWFYGQSIGVSPVGMLIAVAFWTLLWGPVGLVLSGPLTICIVVVGKYVPDLSFFTTILGDTPSLEPSVDFYQRLLARDQDEASQFIAELVESSPAPSLYDEVLIPALAFAQHDREQDMLTESQVQNMYATMGEILDDLGLQLPTNTTTVEVVVANDIVAGATERVKILACPARGQTDLLALEMLQQLLPAAEWELEISAMDTLTAELVQNVATDLSTVILISALPPGGLAHARYLCKRLRAQRRDLKIVVGRWGQLEKIETNRNSLQSAGADRVVTSLIDARKLLCEWRTDLLFRAAHGQTDNPPT
jgi:predicted PurR-regulated permease PerM/cell division inhibitor SulA